MPSGLDQCQHALAAEAWNEFSITDSHDSRYLSEVNMTGSSAGDPLTSPTGRWIFPCPAPVFIDWHDSTKHSRPGAHLRCAADALWSILGTFACSTSRSRFAPHHREVCTITRAPSCAAPGIGKLSHAAHPGPLPAQSPPNAEAQLKPPDHLCHLRRATLRACRATAAAILLVALAKKLRYLAMIMSAPTSQRSAGFVHVTGDPNVF